MKSLGLKKLLQNIQNLCVISHVAVEFFTVQKLYKREIFGRHHFQFSLEISLSGIFGDERTAN